MSDAPRGAEHPGGPLVVEKPTILVDQKAFTLAVQTCLSALANATSPDGTRVGLHPTPFRMTIELRDTLKRVAGMEIEVKDWERLLREVKPPYPGAQDE